MTVCAGAGAISALDEMLARHGAASVFLVTGGRSFRACGAEPAVEAAMVGRRVVRYAEVSPNPTANDIERGVTALRATACDAVVAIGGGSVIDAAKLINLCAAQAATATDLITGRARFTRGGHPLIAVPTTSGTGAEATQFATVYVDGQKYSAADPRMLPDDAILDHRLTASLPPAIAAATGIDALSQAIESYWAVGSSDASRELALDAMRGAFAALPTAVHAPTEAAREAMLRAAHLAGQAINISRTTAPHALSYAFTANHRVPHGHAVGLTLGAVFEHNTGVTDEDVADPRGAAFVAARLRALRRELGLTRPADQLSALMATLGLATRLRDLGISRSDLPALVGALNEERLANNPRRMTRAVVGRILESIY